LTTSNWPERIVPAAAQWQLQKAGVQFVSPFNGTPQSIDVVAERWMVSLTLPSVAGFAGAQSALLNHLSGGVNRVNLWHHGSGGQPAGSLRGVPVLSSAAARGDASIALSGCTNANLFLNGSFEIDSNGDGLANGWTVFVGDAGDGARVHSLLQASESYNVADGVYSQIVGITSASNTNDTGIISGNSAIQASTQYTLSAYMGCSVPSKAYVLVRQYKADGVTVTGSDAATATAPEFAGTLARLSATFVSAADAAFIKVMVRGITLPAENFRVDAIQLERGATASPYASWATLLAGDMIGCSGHLLQVASDCQANDAGAMTVPIINRVRGTITSGAAVTWYKPTAQFIMPAMAGGALQVPGYTQGAALDLLEVW